MNAPTGKFAEQLREVLGPLGFQFEGQSYADRADTPGLLLLTSVAFTAGAMFRGFVDGFVNGPQISIPGEDEEEE